ncbi:MAG: hypothetical protein JSR69_17190 [Proteobacteria bacterium]|nr:hypothetical protein [Pseudomonadota bacterium]
MPVKEYNLFDFSECRQKGRWQSVHAWSDVGEFVSFASGLREPWPYDLTRQIADGLQRIGPDVEARLGGGRAGGSGMLTLYRQEQDGETLGFVAFVQAQRVLLWACQDDGEPVEWDGKACLRKLAALAVAGKPGLTLQLSDQEDKAFMWKASLVHPLQVLENAYQRVVQRAGQETEGDPIAAQSETLSRFFVNDAGKPACLQGVPAQADDEAGQLAAVKMNHLIDSFYLFRLLIQYRLESPAEIDDALRAELSGNLTKLLHNGDRTKMGWLSAWLTEKIADLGRTIERLNRQGKRRVIFFLKGGRALNYFLGTPEKGENDWDTQVVINPYLSAEEWYQCFAEVHDVLLAKLRAFKVEFTALVEANSAAFADYLKTKAGPGMADDEEEDENEIGDAQSLGEHANCKAELIDIGIPRRDSASALEEWTHLSAPDALLAAGGVIYPHREYYLNEYLMMVRDAFMPKADVAKAPKRILRFGLILAAPGADAAPGIGELPGTQGIVAAMSKPWRRELYAIMLSDMIEAYNLRQDDGLAERFDGLCAEIIARPPGLPDGLRELLDEAQTELALDVGVGHAISLAMDAHWAQRHAFFDRQRPFFDALVRELAEKANAGLRDAGAQFAVASSYATRLHAAHLRFSPEGLEPVRRILIKLHCAAGSDRNAVLATVRNAIEQLTDRGPALRVADGNKQSLLLYWTEPVEIGGWRYSPLVMKIRVAEQSGAQLPVLASIDGLPVLDLRYLVADYRRKTSKIDERGARRVLAAATATASAMLSRFDFESDED